MPGIYPIYHSLVEKLAAKVISRVVQDNVALGDAITEAVRYAELTRQQTIHMCSILQDYGMQYNGDPKNYFSYPDGDGLADSIPVAKPGYVVYAGDSSKVKNGSMDKVFSTIAELRKKGFTNDEIKAFNSELSSIIDAIDEVGSSYDKLEQQYGSTLSGSEEVEESVPGFKLFPEPVVKEKAPLANQNAQPQKEELAVAASAKRWRQALEKWAQAADVEAPTNENIEEALKGANAPAAETGAGEPEAAADLGDADLGDADLELDEPASDEGDLDADLGDADLGGSEAVSAKVRPAPQELQSRVKDAPKWEIENILSIQSAENFYSNLRKDLEKVVFNENIVLDAASLKQYDEVRQKIDDELQKIKDAQKETKKLEKKEGELEEEFEVGNNDEEFEVTQEAGPEGELADLGEVPTEEMIVEQDAETK